MIRAALSDHDLDAARELFRAYGDHLATTAAICIGDLEREIAALPDPYVVILLAAVEGATAGCAALKPLSLEGERACELKRLWVSPNFRGHRLGRQLMEAAVGHAVGFGFTTLYLDTVPAAMPEADSLYKALGFHRTGRYNANPVKDVVFYRLDLPAHPGSDPDEEHPGRYRNLSAV